MKRLILMRHAKSDWSDPNASDHARTLNHRGQLSAEALGDWMRANGLHPDHVLCSDAARTQETLAGLALSDVTVETTRKLYLAEPEVMAQLLQSCEGDCVLMIAHNPGSAMLAETLLAQPPAHPEFYSYPTCATLVADFDIAHWHDLRSGTGTPVHFIVPRELME